MSHLSERFAAAVRTLVGDGTVKERLGRAYLEHLEHVEETDLPLAQRPLFAALREAMNRVTPFGKESPIRASVQKMSAADASRHARTIVELYCELAFAERSGAERAEPLKVVSTKPQQPPRFLTGRS